MLTDWVLIGRLASELEQRLRGGRVEDVGLLVDGRVALLFRRGAQRVLVAIDLFASPPMVTLEEGELGISEEPGFVRALARSLRGMTLASVQARRFDRLLRMRFAARSRFGVGESLELYVELVPRFGNVVLVKNDAIVAARKEFPPSQNPLRAVVAGAAYALPPLPEQPRTLPPLAENVSVLDLFAQVRAGQLQHADREMGRRRRDAVLKRLTERERKLRGELSALAAKRESAAERDQLRAQGEDIFSTLHTLDARDAEAAKEHAAKLFARYKKLGKSLPHIAARERDVRAAVEVVETLRWEAERSGDDDLDDVEAAVAELDPRRRQSAAAPARRRKRRALELRTPRGSRIVVGRSPVENAELTFRLARPNDLWFHARGIPGAHVILSRDDRTPVPDEDLAIAAALAAFYSKAQTAVTAAVDYTLRKHVRKQRAAPPGLVWYTEAKTIVATPTSMDAVTGAGEDPGG